MFKCHKFESIDWHKVKVASKFHQAYWLLTARSRHNSCVTFFIQNNRYYRCLAFYAYVSYIFAEAELVKALLQ